MKKINGNKKYLSEKELEKRKISDRSFRIYNPDGTVYAEMREGVWVIKPL